MDDDKDLDRRAAEQTKDVMAALKLAALVIVGLLATAWLLAYFPPERLMHFH